MNDIGVLTRLALDARRFLQPYYREWHLEWGGKVPQILSTWTCTRSSLFFKMVLDLETDLSFHTVSGARLIYALKNDCISHAWLESNTYIVDITSDQFGAPPFLILEKGDHRYRANEKDFIISESANRNNAVNSLWAKWFADKFHHRLSQAILHIRKGQQ